MNRNGTFSVSHNDNVVTCQKFIRELKGLAIINNRNNKKAHEIFFSEKMASGLKWKHFQYLKQKTPFQSLICGVVGKNQKSQLVWVGWVAPHRI